MYWDIYIRIFDAQRREGHWAFCCRTVSAEMCGIAERALKAAGQEVTVQQCEPVPPRYPGYTSND